MFQPQLQIQIGLPQLIRSGVDNNIMAAAAHHQPQYHNQPQHIDIALNSEFVSRLAPGFFFFLGSCEGKIT